MENKKIRILSLDGGGIRGVIPATVMVYIESFFQKHRPGTYLSDHFDLIAGTSTGGILTAFYLTPSDEDSSKPKYCAQDGLDLYVNEGYKIFNKSKKASWIRLWGLISAVEYDPKYIEHVFNREFNELKMSSLMKNCIISTYNMRTKSAHFFASDDNPNQRDFFVRDVLRSTSAAPTYFPPAKIFNRAVEPIETDPVQMVNIDGGVFANNPAMCAYAEARNTVFPDRMANEAPSMKDMLILSIGTGGGNFDLSEVDKSNRWNLIKWAKKTPDIMMDGSLDTVDYQLNEIHNTLNPKDGKQYLRIDYPKSRKKLYSSDMAEASPENISKLLSAGKITLDEALKNGLDSFLMKFLD